MHSGCDRVPSGQLMCTRSSMGLRLDGFACGGLHYWYCVNLVCWVEAATRTPPVSTRRQSACLSCGAAGCFASTVVDITRTYTMLPCSHKFPCLHSACIKYPFPRPFLCPFSPSSAEFLAPCRTNKYPREIPELPWYRTTVPQMIMAGFLPFSAIYVELYYIFASVWGHKVYIIWSILFIVYIILIIVTAFITIALTYFQLAVEDHQWWWRSFLCGGSTGIFVYGYCFYYYYARSDMSGFMQTSFFFGYMAMVCFGFFLMLGTVGWRASLMFVRHIYRAIKCE